MRSRLFQSLLACPRLLPVGALAAAAAGCSGPPASPSPALPPSDVVSVVLDDSGCQPQPAAAPAGEVTFRVRNDRGDGVSQVAVQQSDGATIGIDDNLSPGQSGSIVVWLEAGTYRVACPGAGISTYRFTVSGTALPDWKTQPALTAAVDRYVSYCQQQATLLAAQVRTLDAAVHRGSLDAARSAYTAARVTYEHVEQAVPDSGLDQAINGLMDRAASPAQFSGFHRIEMALWQQGSTAAGVAAADALVRDMPTLQQDLAGIQPQPSDITNAAVSSITNAVSSRLTGEEERFSHLGLLMMQADLESADESYQCVRPWLLGSQPPVATGLDGDFAAAQAALAAVRGGGVYPPDDSLTDAQSQAIAMRFDTLAAAMSRLAVLWTDDDGS